MVESVPALGGGEGVMGEEVGVEGRYIRKNPTRALNAELRRLATQAPWETGEQKSDQLKL